MGLLGKVALGLRDILAAEIGGVVEHAAGGGMAGLQGRVFGGYQLTEQLGGGGIAEVYRGRPQRPGGREVVVKVIYPEFARQPGFLANFQRITQMSTRLATHPHILPLVASGEENGYLYLVTPYVASGSLKEWIVRGGRLGPSDVGPFFRQLCDALGYAHSLGLVHGNVKPSNIFLFEGRHVLLGDFGLLWDVRSMDMTHAGPGTEAVEYMAPELAAGQVSQLSDVYSAGIILFAALVGYPPFRGTTPAEVFAAHAHQSPAHLAQANPSLPPAILALDGTIQRAIAKRPDERFPSASALAQAIEVTIRQAAAVHGQSGAMAGGWPGGTGLPHGMMPLGANPLGIPLLGSPGLGVGGSAMPAAAVSPVLSGSAAIGSAMKPLDPPFPPLPASAQVEEDMEQGRIRINAAAPAESTVRIGVPGGSGQDVPQQATLRVPAAQPASQMLGSTGAGDLLSGGAASVRSFAPPRIGPSQRLTQQTDDEDRDGGQSVPAVRPTAEGNSAGPSVPGFAVAGGAGQWSQENGNGHQPAGWSVAAGPSSAPDEGGWGEWGQDSGTPADGTGQQPRAFSPTKLGLPRLTSPALQDMPPSWHELIGQAPRGSGGIGRSSALSPGSRVPSGWDDAEQDGRGSSPLREPWRSQPGGWDPSETGSWQAVDASQAWDAASAGDSFAASGVAGGWQVSGALPSGAWEPPPGAGSPRGGQVRAAAPTPEDENFWVEDDRVWTKGHRAIRRPLRTRRWVRRLMVLLVLCALLDVSVIVVQRPELCPTSACAAVSTKAHQLFAQFHIAATPLPAVVAPQPMTTSLTVKAGSKSAPSSITLKNLTSGRPAWKATADLLWVTVTPTSGVLAPNGTATLTVSANASGMKAGTYTATITISPAGGQVVHIPVKITVQ